MNTERKHPRMPYSDQLGIPVTIFQFGRLRRQDITVKPCDISEGGLGIISDEPLAPGFIWFWTKIREYDGGMVMWSRQINGKYRAGVQFLNIPSKAKQSPGD